MNKRITPWILLLVLMLALSGCSSDEKENMNDKNQMEEDIGKEEIDKVEEKDEIEEMINHMAIDEKIGQLMIVGFNGTVMDEKVKDMIEKNHIGGLILFKENIANVEQTTQLLNTLKKTNNPNPIPLFLSVDEEGGKVHRLSHEFLKMPSAKKIGDINDEKVSLEYGKILGMRIKSLGFNMDFAPVLDINSNPKNLVIGNRAFGSTVDVVVNNGLQVMRGINSESIVSIIKHFPGHGDTATDSHINIPVVNKELKELESLELVPFTKGIAKGVDGIMVGHILFPKIDSDKPATLSKAIINDILRERLSYNGVVISDDMTMGAIMKNYSIEDAAVEFLKAGGDIVLVCHGYEDQLKVIDKIKEKVENGNITEKELDEKVQRIIKLKQKYNIQDNLIDKADIESINTKTKKLLDEIK
jgi:beta-N-acetylhexosaminidase